VESPRVWKYRTARGEARQRARQSALRHHFRVRVTDSNPVYDSQSQPCSQKPSLRSLPDTTT
jgi:hypothetical protein